MTLRGWLGLTLLPGVYAALEAERAHTVELRAELDGARVSRQAEIEYGRQRVLELEQQFAKERVDLLNRFVGLPPGERSADRASVGVGLTRPVSPLQRQMKAAFDSYQAALRANAEVSELQVPPVVGGDELADDYLRQQAVNGVQ